MQHIAFRYGVAKLTFTSTTAPFHAATLIGFNGKRVNKFTIVASYPYNIFITVKSETALIATSRSAVPISCALAETSAPIFLRIDDLNSINVASGMDSHFGNSEWELLRVVKIVSSCATGGTCPGKYNLLATDGFDAARTQRE